MKHNVISLFVGLILVACGGGGGSSPSPYTLVAFNADGDFFALSPTTGQATPLADTYYQPFKGDPAVELEDVSSCVYNPETDEIWIGPGGRGACRSCILRLDLATGEAIRLMDNADAGIEAIPGMAVGPNGTIYTSQYSHKFAEPSDDDGLYSLNNQTGAAVHLSMDWPGAVGNGMTFDAAGELYFAADGKLYWVDLDGDPTAMPPVAPFTAIELRLQNRVGFPFDPGTLGDIISMATHPDDGTILCIFKVGAGRGGGGGTSGPCHLARVNIATGTVTFIVQLPFLMDGLAYVPTDVLSDA